MAKGTPSGDFGDRQIGSSPQQAFRLFQATLAELDDDGVSENLAHAPAECGAICFEKL